MKYRVLGFVILSILITGCKSNQQDYIYETDALKIIRLSETLFIHETYLETKDFGYVACNGVIAISNGEALIFDTPTTDRVSEELMDWVVNDQDAKLVGIVVTHFHIDCLGGLNAFHENKIPSYALDKTIQLAQQNNRVTPQHKFSDNLDLEYGNHTVNLFFPGEGHTKDNIVAYFPHQRSLFGGCLIKSVGASKGNLEDANEEQWSNTVLEIKNKSYKIDKVIPGHGNNGGPELLDYTIELFETHD